MAALRYPAAAWARAAAAVLGRKTSISHPGPSCKGSGVGDSRDTLTTQLAAQAPELHVLLSGIPDTWRSLPKHHITQLALQHITITPEVLTQQLQLAACTALRRLLVSSCDSSMKTSSRVALTAQRATWLPASLTALSEARGCTSACVQDLLQLLGPQLTHFSTHAGLDDALTAALLPLPRLSHVRCEGRQRVRVDRDFSQAGCKWQVLEVVQAGGFHMDYGQDAAALARLPLQHIQEVVVHSGLTFFGHHSYHVALAACTRGLAACPKLRCVPTPSKHVDMEVPVFTFHTNGPLLDCRGLLDVCVGSISGPAALHLPLHEPEWNFGDQWPEVPGCVAQLPPHITSLCLSWGFRWECEAYNYDHFVDCLPAHITEVLLASGMSDEDHGLACVTAGLAAALSRSPAHQRLRVRPVVWPGYTRMPALWQLQAAHPERVHLAFLPTLVYNYF